MLTELRKPFDEYMGVEVVNVMGLGFGTAKEVAEKGEAPSSFVIASLYAQGAYEFFAKANSL